MPPMRLLVVEDEKKVASFIKKGLEEEGYAVDVASDGAEGLDLALEGVHDFIILDIRLPKMDGLQVLQALRQERVTTPVLLLTVRATIEEKVLGLDAGADDYLTKPFAFQELVARVRALLRRRPEAEPTVLQVGDLILDPARRTVARGGAKIELTPREFTLLDYFMRNPGGVLTPTMIAERVWDFSFDTSTNVIDVYVNYLRKKIDADREPKLLHTVRGVGYVFKAEKALPPPSIRARLTLWYTGLLTVTILLLGASAYSLLGYSLARDLDRALQGVAVALAEQPSRSRLPTVSPDIDAIFRRFFGMSPWDRYVERRHPWSDRPPQESPSGTGRLPLSAQALSRASEGLETFETLEGLGPYPVRVLTHPVQEAGRSTSLIQVGMSLESVSVTRRHFLLVLAAVLPLAVLLAGSGGWLLARRALRPVDRMTEAARRISAEHLDERVHTTGTGDELDRLAATLNDMLGRLDVTFRQIRQFSADASHELQTPLTIL